MGINDLFAGAVTSAITWYYTNFKRTGQEGYFPYGGLEQLLEKNTTYLLPERPRLGANLDYFTDVVDKSRENGLHGRLEDFLEDRYGAAPKEKYHIGHDSIEDAILAYTDTKEVIGVGPNFKQGMHDIAARYGISPDLAAFITYGHERAHMAQGAQTSTKAAEIDADSAMEAFLRQQERRAQADGDVWMARQYRNAQAYQQDRLRLLQHDAIDAYRDAA